MDEEFIWYKQNFTDKRQLSSEEEERIHYHGGTLFIFNLSSEDSGLYITWHLLSSGQCNMYFLEICVSPNCPEHVYQTIKVSDRNPIVPCMEFVDDSCKDLNGNITWYKNGVFLPGSHEVNLRVNNATKADEGDYFCICTWKHNHRVYNSSGSTKLELREPAAVYPPLIISPANEEQLADEGSRMILNCSAFCGRNVRECRAEWLENGMRVKGQTFKNFTEKQKVIFTAVLTIESVSTQHFQTKFKCFAKNLFTSTSKTLTLKPRDSIVPLVIGGVCVVFICVVVAVIVKCFAIDLTLLFRRCIKLSQHDDAKVYDAYVVYQAHSADKASEDTLCQFVTDVLPSVLEQKCGYSLFIHGRDDIPGEDRLELVEARMKLSRRLMVILTPGSGSGSEVPDQHHAFLPNTVERGYDWQMGMHQALVHRDMSVILIQLGEFWPQDYTHLPPSMQHLVRQSAPLRWPQGSRTATMWNSRFWKRVRYMMPATPAKTQLQCALI
ncbi:interleukin-1 receptor-like 1 isoform X2 [Genypterus blacodes]